MKRLFVEFGFDCAAGKNCLYFRGKDETGSAGILPAFVYIGATMRVIKRLNSHPIPHERQRPLSLVPNRKRKHPIEPWQTIHAPFRPCGQQDFRVRLGSEIVAFGCELRAQFAIVVDLAVQRDYKTAISRQHRLMARTARVDDRQAAMTETNSMAVTIDRP